MTSRWDPEWVVTPVRGPLVFLHHQRSGKTKVLNKEKVRIVNPEQHWDDCRPRPKCKPHRPSRYQRLRNDRRDVQQQNDGDDTGQFRDGPRQRNDSDNTAQLRDGPRQRNDSDNTAQLRDGPQQRNDSDNTAQLRDGPRQRNDSDNTAQLRDGPRQRNDSDNTAQLRDGPRQRNDSDDTAQLRDGPRQLYGRRRRQPHRQNLRATDQGRNSPSYDFLATPPDDRLNVHTQRNVDRPLRVRTLSRRAQLAAHLSDSDSDIETDPVISHFRKRRNLTPTEFVKKNADWKLFI